MKHRCTAYGLTFGRWTVNWNSDSLLKCPPPEMEEEICTTCTKFLVSSNYLKKSFLIKSFFGLFLLFFSCLLLHLIEISLFWKCDNSSLLEKETEILNLQKISAQFQKELKEIKLSWFADLKQRDYLEESLRNITKKERGKVRSSKHLIQQKCGMKNFSSRAQTVTIYDGFSFFDELELLEIRLGELYEVVDYFILVESNRTFRGTLKPLYFLENKDMFSNYLDKIIYIQCNLDSFGIVETDNFNEKLLDTHSLEYKAVWKREKATRDCIQLGLSNLFSNPANNILLVSDVDEIPRPQFFKWLRNCNVPDRVVIQMPRYNFKFSWVVTNENRQIYTPWYGTIAVKQTQIDPNGLDKQRSDRAQFYSFRNFGWHFSNFNFGVGRYESKLRNFAHQEHSHPKNIQQLMQGIENAPQTQNLLVLSQAETWCSLPKYVFENPIKFANQTGLSQISPYPTQKIACSIFIQELKAISSIPTWIYEEMFWE